MKHLCKRCLYISDRKSSMLDHLTKAKECEVKIEDGGLNISRQHLVIEIEKKGGFPCTKNCGAFLKTDKIRLQHESKCFHVDTIPVSIVVPALVTHVSAFGETNTIINKVFPSFENLVRYGDGLIAFIKEFCFNPQYEAGRNIMKLEKEGKFMQVFDGKVWKNENIYDCLPHLFIQIGHHYNIAKSPSKGIITELQINELKHKIIIPLDFHFWEYKDEKYSHARHGAARTDLYARISNLIFEESNVMLANGHSRDAISDECVCILCKPDFDNKLTEPFDFFIEDKSF